MKFPPRSCESICKLLVFTALGKIKPFIIYNTVIVPAINKTCKDYPTGFIFLLLIFVVIANSEGSAPHQVFRHFE